MIDRTVFWTVLVVLSIATYAIRFSFLGLLGNRPLPQGLVRCLRYTAVAVLPALVAPAVLWPTATQGHTDPARLLAAIVTLGVGLMSRSMFGAIAAGLAVLYTVPLMFG